MMARKFRSAHVFQPLSDESALIEWENEEDCFPSFRRPAANEYFVKLVRPLKHVELWGGLDLFTIANRFLQHKPSWLQQSFWWEVPSVHENENACRQDNSLLSSLPCNCRSLLGGIASTASSPRSPPTTPASSTLTSRVSGSSTSSGKGSKTGRQSELTRSRMRGTRNLQRRPSGRKRWRRRGPCWKSTSGGLGVGTSPKSAPSGCILPIRHCHDQFSVVIRLRRMGRILTKAFDEILGVCGKGRWRQVSRLVVRKISTWKWSRQQLAG
jgi:hypothetical protein